MLFHYNSKDFEVYLTGWYFFLWTILACGKWRTTAFLTGYVLLQCTFQEESKESSGISHKLIGNTESHLKYENDRLKMALAQR